MICIWKKATCVDRQVCPVNEREGLVDTPTSSTWVFERRGNRAIKLSHFFFYLFIFFNKLSKCLWVRAYILLSSTSHILQTMNLLFMFLHNKILYEKSPMTLHIVSWRLIELWSQVILVISVSIVNLWITINFFFCNRTSFVDWVSYIVSESSRNARSHTIGRKPALCWNT